MGAWDRAARLYDAQLPLERAALRAAVDLAAPGPGERLLDLGTGTGGVLRELRRRPAVPAEVVGVDTSAAMLDRAPALPAGWRLLRAAATDLPLPDGGFDVVSCAYLLHLLVREERAAVLAEARRVLRPGGRMVSVTVAAPRRPGLARAVDALLRPAPMRSGVLAGLCPLDPRAAMAAAGFEVERARRVLRGYPSLTILARRE